MSMVLALDLLFKFAVVSVVLSRIPAAGWSWDLFWITIGNRHFAECRRLCRVYFIGHSGKTVFAECQIKYTQHKKTLDKIRLCRVPFFWHSAKMYFAECYFSAHDKIRLCRVSFFWHSAKMYFAECLCFGTRQRGILPCAFFLPSANQFFKAIFEALNEFK